jgi:DNA-binding TFAR19-related protein (PDSD5 family)
MSRVGRAFGRLQFERLALRYDLFRGEQLAAERVLEEMQKRGEMDDEVREEILRTYRAHVHTSKERLEDLRANPPEVARAIETRLARRIQPAALRRGDPDSAAAGRSASRHRAEPRRGRPPRVPAGGRLDAAAARDRPGSSP